MQTLIQFYFQYRGEGRFLWLLSFVGFPSQDLVRTRTQTILREGDQ